MGSGNWLLYQKFVLFFGTFWFSVSTYLLPLFGFLKAYLFRNHSEISSLENCNKSLGSVEPEPESKEDFVENSVKSSAFIDPQPELVLISEIDKDVGGAETHVSDGFVEEENDEFCFRFKFPSYEEFSKSRRENGDFVCYEAIAQSYETLGSSSVEGTDPLDEEGGLNDDHDEAKAVQEEVPEGSTNGSCSDCSQEKSETTPIPFTEENEQTVGGQESLHDDVKAVQEEMPEGSTSDPFSDYLQEKSETIPIPFTEENEQTVGGHESLHGDQQAPAGHDEGKAVQKEEAEGSSSSCSDCLQEKTETTPVPFTEENKQTVGGQKSLHGDQELQDFSDMDSDSGSFSSSPLRLVMNRILDSYSEGFLSDRDFGVESDAEMDLNEEDHGGPSHNDEVSELNETQVDDSSDEEEEEEEETYTIEELGKIEQAHLKSVANLKSNFLSEKDFTDEKSEESTGKGKSIQDWDSEDSNQLETLWEHQELIEQLKMELKKVRATGLPTILEESDESPKIMEDLKPWKINEKFRHVDRVNELHKFYKSYRERMRKFDILNYQKMYAIGFLQLKDPLQSVSGKNSSVPSAESFLTQNSWLPKRKKIGNDPMLKFLRELQCDLEVVYVGQMCLSWEILHWQYEKALELWESDSHGIRRYNEVAGEFQQFQVLGQRFVEDETFQGPRVQNYVKNRCIHRNLLQVPVIREDSTKDRKKAIESDYAITSDMLVEIMEESIRIFWRFVRADKDCSSGALKFRKGPPAELQDPADSDLLIEVQASLAKKEKKLKDLLRTGNCILKKFRKCQEEDTDHVLYFFSQVDMKLVCRVLNMSRITTEQLIWCRNKLSRISFVNRKLRVEPSFLLFPC